MNRKSQVPPSDDGIWISPSGKGKILNVVETVAALESEGFDVSTLDSVVHDAASSLGSSANNGGRLEQVRFLVHVCRWTGEEVLAAARKEG